MAVLHAAARRALNSSKFGVPGKRALPINDEEHARKALQLGPRAVSHGTITPGEFASAKAKVHRDYPDIKSSRPGKRVLGKMKGGKS